MRINHGDHREIKIKEINTKEGKEIFIPQPILFSTLEHGNEAFFAVFVTFVVKEFFINNPLCSLCTLW